MSIIKRMVKYSQPLHLFLSALAYTLGTGIAHYLNGTSNPIAFGLGLAYVILLQFSAFLLVQYYRLPLEPLEDDQTQRLRTQLRIRLLQISAAALTLAAALTILLLYGRMARLGADFFLVMIFVLLMAYAVPPVRLVDRGFGELVLAVLWANFYPALAYLLQSEDFFRLLPLVTFPLTLLALSYLLIYSFPHFATDLKYNRRSLLVQLTWPRAIPIHHFLVVAAYLLFAIAPLFGLAWELVRPVFLTLPLAGFQIYWLQRISQGGRTLWNVLIPYAAAVFGLTLYLLAFTFWIR